MISTTNHIRGEQLRRLREVQGISVADLAQHVHLSSAQILQIEYGDVLPGKRSMFYSPAIEEIAAVKVANALGADPQTLWNNKPIVEINMETVQTQESPVQEKIESRSNRENSFKNSDFAFSRPRFPLEKPDKNILMPALGSALVFSLCLAFFYTQTNFSLKALANDVLSLSMNKREVQTQSIPLAPAPVPAPTKASPEPIKAMPQTQKSITTVVQAVAFGGCDDQKTAIYLSTDQPQKAGISVYIEALEEVSLCVGDSAGVQHTTTLKAKEKKHIAAPPFGRFTSVIQQRSTCFFKGENSIGQRSKVHLSS